MSNSFDYCYKIFRTINDVVVQSFEKTCSIRKINNDNWDTVRRTIFPFTETCVFSFGLSFPKLIMQVSVNGKIAFLTVY